MSGQRRLGFAAGEVFWRLALTYVCSNRCSQSTLRAGIASGTPALAEPIGLYTFR
jgi:hypothetical protein